MRASVGRILFPPRNAETLAWRAAVVAAGGSVSNQRLLIVDKLIYTLKGPGVWAKMDRLWLFAAENSQSALRDIKAATAATATGSPAFTRDRGYAGVDASTTVYIDLGVNLSTLGGNYSQNSAHISAWSNSDTESSGSGGEMIGNGATAGSATGIFPKYSGGAAYYLINDSDLAPSGGLTNTVGTGHYLANRSGAAAQQGYRNAVDQGVVAATSAAPNNINMTALGQNHVTSGHQLGAVNQNCMVSVGGSLTAGQVALFYAALRTYMTAVGVP